MSMLKHNSVLEMSTEMKGRDRSRPGLEFDEKEHCCDSRGLQWFKFFFAFCHEDRGECIKC
jgi:hypothetical protein